MEKEAKEIISGKKIIKAIKDFVKYRAKFLTAQIRKVVGINWIFFNKNKSINNLIDLGVQLITGDNSKAALKI